MDGNKDEALKCLKIGKDALESGDRPRALKFITKARRLDPNLPVDDLLSALEGDQSSRPSVSDSSSTTKNDAQDGDGGSPSLSKPSGIPSLRHRGGPSSGSSSSSASQSNAFTEEQISIVRQIKRQKDYYEILGLEKSCSVEDVRKAYRKFSLKVHPDKNKAPGAEEAFKAVSKAFKCLSDEESRKRYDVSGSDEVVYERAAARRRGAQGFNGFYDADIDAEEIFRSFFFGGAPRATTQFGGFTFGTGMGPSVHTGGGNGSGNFNVRALVQLLPILLIILLNFLPSSQPIYALSKSYPYEYHVVTPRGVNYYVRTAKFEQEYPPSSLERVKLEERVESDYRSIITQNCRVELQRRQWGFTRETPHCDLLRQFEAAA